MSMTGLSYYIVLRIAPFHVRNILESSGLLPFPLLTIDHVDWES
jgi:hypothetical protein